MAYQGRQAFGIQVKLRMETGEDAVKASLTDGTSDQQIVFTAKTAGTAGNSISVEVIDDTDLEVTVVGQAISIEVDVEVHTVNDVIAAIYANADAAALIDATSGAGDGTGFITALTETNLSGGAAATHTYQVIQGIGDIDLPGLGRTKIDFTSHSSPGGFAEYEKGKVRDGRDFTIPLNYDPADAVHIALKAAEASDDPVVMQFIFPNGDENYESEVLVLNFPASGPVRDKLMANVECCMTGQPTAL